MLAIFSFNHDTSINVLFMLWHFGYIVVAVAATSATDHVRLFVLLFGYTYMLLFIKM